MQAVKAHAILRVCAVSPERSLLAIAISNKVSSTGAFVYNVFDLAIVMIVEVFVLEL